MARGQSAGGKRDKAAPDWLRPPEERDNGAPAAPREEKRRRNRDDDDDEEYERSSKKKGIKMGPLIFLVMMVLPGLASIVVPLFDKLQYLGYIKMPTFTQNPYRPCLQEFYADWAPEKLGDLDTTLSKFEGKERQLFGKLQKKYGKKANIARCTANAKAAEGK